jgi:hypothetical protein
MAVTVEGEKQLRWCADRALLEYDHDGGAQAALSSVLSDFTKSELTANINPMLAMMIVGEAANKGRNELEKAIMDFNI